MDLQRDAVAATIPGAPAHRPHVVVPRRAHVGRAVGDERDRAVEEHGATGGLEPAVGAQHLARDHRFGVGRGERGRRFDCAREGEDVRLDDHDDIMVAQVAEAHGVDRRDPQFGPGLGRARREVGAPAVVGVGAARPHEHPQRRVAPSVGAALHLAHLDAGGSGRRGDDADRGHPARLFDVVPAVDDHELHAVVQVRETFAGRRFERREVGQLGREVEVGPVEHGRGMGESAGQPPDLATQRSGCRGGGLGQVEDRTRTLLVDHGPVRPRDVVPQLGLLPEPLARSLGEDEGAVALDAPRLELRDGREVVGERPALRSVRERRGLGGACAPDLTRAARRDDQPGRTVGHRGGHHLRVPILPEPQRGALRRCRRLGPVVASERVAHGGVVEPDDERPRPAQRLLGRTREPARGPLGRGDRRDPGPLEPGVLPPEVLLRGFREVARGGAGGRGELARRTLGRRRRFAVSTLNDRAGLAEALLARLGKLLRGGAGGRRDVAPTLADHPAARPEHEAPATSGRLAGRLADRLPHRTGADRGGGGLDACLRALGASFDLRDRLAQRPQRVGTRGSLSARGRHLGLEIPDPVPLPDLGRGELGSEPVLALLEPVDRGLALVGVTGRDGTVEDQPAHPSLVGRRLVGHGRAGFAAQIGVQAAQARARAGIGQVDADRVVPEVGAHPRRCGVEPGEVAQPGDLTCGVDEERVVVGDDPPLGGAAPSRSRSSAPTGRGRASTSSGSGA